MSTAIVKIDEQLDSKIDLIKRTVAVGATDDELSLFLHQCKKSGLDPLSKQIYCVKRWNSKEQRETMTIQVGIDGYRVIADRTGKYAPGRAPVFEEREGQIYSATAFVMKLVGNKWHEVSATAFWSEYVQTFYDRKAGKHEVSPFWKRMGHTMLSKCAEALALRKAFPADLSGIYTHEEMQQADSSEGLTPLSKCTYCGIELPDYKTVCDKCSAERTQKTLTDGAAEAPKAETESAVPASASAGGQPNPVTAPSLSELRAKVIKQTAKNGKVFYELDGKVLLWKVASASEDDLVGRVIECTALAEGVKRGFQTFRLEELVHIADAQAPDPLQIQEEDLEPLLRASVTQVAEKKKMADISKELSEAQHSEDIPF